MIMAQVDIIYLTMQYKAYVSQRTMGYRPEAQYGIHQDQCGIH